MKTIVVVAAMLAASVASAGDLDGLIAVAKTANARADETGRQLAAITMLMQAAESETEAVGQRLDRLENMRASTVKTFLVYEVPAGWYVVVDGKIVPFGQQPTPGPTPDPNVPPVVPDASKLIADLINSLPASDARHKNAIKLAGTLRLLADQAKERQLAADAIIGVYSPLMAIAVPDEDWKPIHAAIVAGLKGCQSPAVCASTLEQYAAGAMATVPSKANKGKFHGASADEIAAAADEYGFDWATILEILIPLLLKLLMEWLSYLHVAAVLIC